MVPAPSLATCQERRSAVIRFGVLHGEREDRPKEQPLWRRLGDQLPAVLDGEGASEFRGNRQRPAGTKRERGSKGIETARAKNYTGRRAVLLPARPLESPRKRPRRHETSFRSGVCWHFANFIANRPLAALSRVA